MSATQAEINIQPTSYRVSLLPVEHAEFDVFSIGVEWRGGDRWAVSRWSSCCDACGNWDWESIPSERTDEWIARHRFSFDEAMAIAKQEAPKVEVNNTSVLDVLARERA